MSLEQFRTQVLGMFPAAEVDGPRATYKMFIFGLHAEGSVYVYAWDVRWLGRGSSLQEAVGNMRKCVQDTQEYLSKLLEELP